MSILNEYRSTKEILKELEQRLSELSGDSRLEKELEFEAANHNLLFQLISPDINQWLLSLFSMKIYFRRFF